VWAGPGVRPDAASVLLRRAPSRSTPRWTAYDQVRFGIKMSPEVPMVQQERPGPSPIWYTPGKNWSTSRKASWPAVVSRDSVASV